MTATAASPKDDYAFVQDVDHKLAARVTKASDEVLAYFAQYPEFRKSLLTSKGINKICNVIERSDSGGLDKKALALTCMEAIALPGKLTKNDLALAANTIDWLHSKGLIHASYIQLFLAFLKRIFRWIA